MKQSKDYKFLDGIFSNKDSWTINLFVNKKTRKVCSFMTNEHRFSEGSSYSIKEIEEMINLDLIGDKK